MSRMVCYCFGVTEAEIREAIHAGQLRTPAQIGDACMAGRGCHTCVFELEDILADYWREQGEEWAPRRPPGVA